MSIIEEIEEIGGIDVYILNTFTNSTSELLDELRVMYDILIHTVDKNCDAYEDKLVTFANKVKTYFVVSDIFYNKTVIFNCNRLGLINQ